MPVTTATTIRQPKIIRCIFRCEHTFAIPIPADTSAARKCVIEARCACQLCPECRAMKAEGKARR